MHKALKITGVGVLVSVVAIQFFRPDRVNPATDPALGITEKLSVPGDVKAILERSCFDCHSHETRWPWYSNVAPASWLVAGDVRNGRAHMNFSAWGTYSRGRQISRLDMLVSEVDKDDMPPRTYLLMHADASLSPGEKDLLSTWAEHVSDSLTASGK